MMNSLSKWLGPFFRIIKQKSDVANLTKSKKGASTAMKESAGLPPPKTTKMKSVALSGTKNVLEKQTKKAEGLKKETKKADEAKKETKKADEAKKETKKAGGAKKEVAKVEGAKIEAAKVEGAKIEAAKVEGAKIEAAKVEEAKKEEAAKVEGVKKQAVKETMAKKPKTARKSVAEKPKPIVKKKVFTDIAESQDIATLKAEKAAMKARAVEELDENQSRRKTVTDQPEWKGKKHIKLSPGKSPSIKLP